MCYQRLRGAPAPPHISGVSILRHTPPHPPHHQQVQYVKEDYIIKAIRKSRKFFTFQNSEHQNLVKTLWLYVVLVKSCCCLLRLHLEDLLSRASNFSQTHSICSTHSEERTQKVKTWCQKLHINWVLAKEEIVQDVTILKIITYS